VSRFTTPENLSDSANSQYH